MPAELPIVCAACGTEVAPDVPEYYVELECFRIISEREDKTPRRGSKEYHEAFEKLAPEVREAYFKNREMYDEGYRWCPVCGTRLSWSGGDGPA